MRRFVVAIFLLAIMESAMAQNYMGPIFGNQGIITQNQQGNNTINIGPQARQADQNAENELISALSATKVTGNIAVQTDLMNCPDCDGFARQFERIFRAVPGWNVTPIRNGITFLSFKGVALGVKNKNEIPASAKAVVAAFRAVGATLSIVEFVPPDGSESVIIVAQPN